MVELNMEPGRPHVVGTDGNDTIYGMNHELEMIEGGDGDDVLYGWGSVWLYDYGDPATNPAARDRADIIFGGAGNDTIRVTSGQPPVDFPGGDQAYGGSGNDAIYGSSLADMLYGGMGNDYITGSGGRDTIDGGFGNDFLSVTHLGFGGWGNDTIDAWRAEVHGGGGNDEINFGFAVYAYLDEMIRAQFGRAYGGSGNDTLRGSNGGERLHGGDGDDVLWADYNYRNDQTVRPPDVLSGDGGNDLIYGGYGRETLDGGAGDDWISGDEIAFDGHPLGEGIIADDVIFGGAGHDTIKDDGGRNRIDGGTGNDNIRVSAIEGNSTIDGGYGNDGLTNVYGGVARGGYGNDTIVANHGTNYMAGNDGDDQLFGGSGNDTINGHRGSDVLSFGGGQNIGSGGAGADIFEFTEIDVEAWTMIEDFRVTDGDLIRVGWSQDIASLVAGAYADGNDVVIRIEQGAGVNIVLSDFDLGDLTPDCFTR